jgi:hypothetical protein
MKKFLSISALMVVLTSGAFVALGTASRIRPTTNRLFAYNYRNHLRRKTKTNTQNKEMQKFQFWYNFNQQKKRKYDRKNYAAWRSAHDALFPRDNNLYSSKKNIVRNDDAKTVRSQKVIVKNQGPWTRPVEGITFQLADAIVKNDDGQYTDKSSDLVFEINKFSGGCSSLGFQQCAITRAKHLRARRDLKAIWNVSREFSLRRSFIGNKAVLVPHFQETFTVNDFGTERTYVINTIQNPVTDEVVYVEGWASEVFASRAENLLRAVSRTIRFQ